MDFLKRVENLTLLEGAYAYTFLSDTRQPEIKVFSLLICLDATKCVLPSAFTLQVLIGTICLKFGHKNYPKMSKVYFQLVFIAQKYLCVSSLLSSQRKLNRTQTASRNAVKLKFPPESFVLR